MKKYILALIAGIALAVGSVAAPAQATHPQVSGIGTCNPETGLFDVVWTVTTDPGYSATGVFVYADRLTDQIVSETVWAGNGAAIDPAPTETAATSAPLSLTVGIQFSNHAEGNIVYNTGSVTFLSEACESTPEPTPTPEPTCDLGQELQPTEEGYVCGPTDPPCTENCEPPQECVPSSTTLACTGLNENLLAVGAIAATGVLMAGIGLMLTQVRHRRAAHRA